MQPKYAIVKDFTSYIEERIDFESFGSLFAVIGQNGHGKSSLIDMITVAIFGRGRGIDKKGSGMDELIRKGAEQFEIDYVFTMNGNEYEIIRRKSKTTHELEFYINGISQTEKISETQAKIRNVFKMDYETFMDTVCIGQGNSGSFMEKSPNDRKDVFVQVLGLDKYEALENYTKERKKEVKTDIEKTESKLEELTEFIANKETYEEQRINGKMEVDSIKVLIGASEEELEKLVSEKAQYEQLKKQRDLIISQRTNLKNKISTTNNSITSNIETKTTLEKQAALKDKAETKIKELQLSIEQNQIDYNKLSNEKSSLEAQSDMYTAQAKELKAKYDKLKNYNEAECNFCGHEITKEYKEQHLKELMEEGKNYVHKVKAIADSVTELDTKIKEIKLKLNQDNTSLNDLRPKYNKILQAETQLEGIVEKIADLENQLKDFEKDYQENMQIKVDVLEDKTFNVEGKRFEIKQLRDKLTNWENKIAIAEKQIIAIVEAESQIDIMEHKLLALQTMFEDYNDLAIAWGKGGIQAVIIENALPEIEEEINKILDVLCNGKIGVSFKTQKDPKTKSKKTKNPASIETLDIIINDENGSRKYETYSGGEKFRVDFACHVGLAKFLAKRAGATIDFFIVDEGLGSQDDNARQQFVTSVYGLTKVFKKIMCITHIEEMKEAFKTKVLVEKDPIEGSKVTLLSV